MTDTSTRLGDCQMITVDGAIACEWCNTRFNPRSVRGRRPRFCRGSHRVRACERRRGLLRAGSPPVRATLPNPGRHGAIGVEVQPFTYLGHERGTPPTIASQTFRRLRLHRVRVTGLAHGDRADTPGLVPALCGAMVKPVGNPVQSGSSWLCCRSCERLSHLHPVDQRWWDSMTQQSAAVLMDDLGSTVLAIGQAVAGVRDPVVTLTRVEQELRRLGVSLGLVEPLPPSLHHRSASPR